MDVETVTEAEIEAITRQLQQAAAVDLTVRLDSDSTDETETAVKSILQTLS